MSCDNNTRIYCEQAGARIAPALGVSLAEATALVLQVHEMGTIRARQVLAARKGDTGQGAASRQAALTARAADTAAEEATVEIFRDMRAMTPQMAVPAHGDANPQYGFALPKRPIQYGWKEVRDLRRIALEGAQAGLSAGVLRARLSPLASEVLHAQQAQSGVNGGSSSAALRLKMARRGYQTGPASILIEVEGQMISISGSDFGTILTAIKALPGVDGKCYNADLDGRGKRWVVPGTSAAVAAALHGYGMTVANTAPPTILGNDALVAITNGHTGPGARAYLDTIWGLSGMGGTVPAAVRLAGMAYNRDRDNPDAQRMLAQALAESQHVARCPNCGQFQGQSAHSCPAIAGIPGAHTAVSLNGWAQAITMVPGVRDVASGQISIELSQPGPNGTADALFSAALAVATGALPPGVSAPAALEQAARAWIASRGHRDAQTFAQAVLAATALPAAPAVVAAAAAPAAKTPPDSGSLVDAQSLPGALTSDDRAEDADANQSGRTCADCGELMGQSSHICHPAWMESYPDDLRSRAQQFVTGLPGIVELANRSKPLGSGPHATTERRALETYATYMQETDGIAPDAMHIAEAYRDQPFRNAQALAAVIVIASGVQKCPDCGQFMSATVGHDCPARLSAVPTDTATIDWLGALAGTDAIRHAYNLRGGWEDSHWGGAGGSISRGFSTSQTRLWDRDDAERDDDEEFDEDVEFDEEVERDDDADSEQADEYGLSDRAAAFWKRRDWNGGPGRDVWAQDRAAREARTQAVIDGLLPTAQEILAGHGANHAQIPTALYIAADAFDARPDVDNARLLAGIISDLSRGRPSRLLGLPSENRVTAWRALRAAPDLPDFANGLASFGGDDGKMRAALDEAARGLSVRNTLPAGLNDAVIDYAAQPARYAADLAGALCAAGGVQQCGKCGQFIGTTEHVCAVISANGKIYDQNGYDREGYNRRGYTKEGYNQAGLEENGYSKQGLDTDGYNRAGFNAKGFRKDTYNEAGFDGTGYAADGRDEQGYDRQGLDPDGYDKNGLDAHGFDRNGWNKAGQNAAGETHTFFLADARGLYGDAFDAEGFDEGGYAADGRDLYGYDKNGIGPYGYDRWGFSAWGLDSQGRDRGGFVQGLGADGFDRTGYNSLGLDRNGFSFTGYDNDGKDRFGQERTSTVSPKTGKALPAKYNQSGTDQFGYDRWGINKKTGLTAADAQGRQYNYCGWVYDGATRCVNLRNPAEWVPHTGWSWERRPGGWLGYGQGYLGNGYAAPRMTPGARYAPPPPPTDPRMPPTFDAFKQGAPMPQAYETGKGYFADDRKVREQYDKLIKGGRKRRVGYRWLRSEQRLAEDPQAVLAGVPLRCPECGRFTGGKAHACPKFGNQIITSFISGVVRGGPYDAVLQTPHNPSYSVPTTVLTENVRQGYTQDPNDGRRWVDAEGFDFEGLSENGFDRAGYTREGFNRFGYDRDGFDRRGYNKDGLDRDGHSRPLTLAVVANGLAEGQDPINNRHIADTFSRVATQIAGRPRRVLFREPGSGFATDMQGKIFADPQPLGPDAPHAQQLVAIKAGIYHELGHEQFTSMGLWAGILDIMQSKQAQDVEVDLRFAGLGVQTVRIDRSRTFVKDAYNIVEDGRMERRIDDRYAGAGEILAADALVNPRWGEHTRAPDGTVLPTEDVVPWALLYEALPFFNVRPSTYARMAGDSRALFDELAPIVRAAVNARPEDAWAAAVYIAARMEQAGVQMPKGSRGTDPGTPPPGTEARRPKIVIEGDQLIDAGQMQSGGGGGMDMDVEFQGHVTVRGQMPSEGGGGGGQTTFAGGVTYEEEQQNQPAQNHVQGQQGQPAQQGQQAGQQGQPGEQSAQEGGGGEQPAAQGQPGQQGASGGSGGDQQSSQRQPDQGEGQGSGGGGDRRYQPTGQHGAGQSGGSGQGEDDDTNGRGQGWRKGLGQGEDATGQDGQPGQAADGDAPNGQQGAPGGSTVADADMQDYWKDWNADSQQDAIGNDPGQQSDRGQGAGGRGHAATRQGGSPFRDAGEPFTKAQLAGVLASAEREAVSALDSGIRVESRVEVLGAALHQPLGNRSSAKQRYKTSDGRIEGVQVGMPKASAATVDQWKGRRTDHKKVAGRMATVLQAIRSDVEKRLRNLPEGALDRRRIVRAAAGQQNVRTQSLTLPQTSFRASVAVDLSGSMSNHIRSGALYDAMMVLGDTFELLDIPYESRAFGSTDAQFKAMDEPTFNPARAAALTETNLGGTQLSSTASLAMTALRGGAEANRLFVSLTDGDLGDQAATAAVLKDARKRGIVTFGIFLGHSANKESMDELWGAGNWTQINALEEMPKAVGQRMAALFNRLAQR